MSNRYVSSAKRAIETRQKAGFSLSDIAAQTGINKGNLSKLARGVRPPSPAERRALGIAPPKPSGIRVRMSTAEGQAVADNIDASIFIEVITETSLAARVARRIEAALEKANHAPD